LDRRQGTPVQCLPFHRHCSPNLAGIYNDVSSAAVSWDGVRRHPEPLLTPLLIYMACLLASNSFFEIPGMFVGRYEDGGKVRPVMHRASMVEIIVPYGDPRAPFHKKCAFDIVDYGLGASCSSLDLGCDCLGYIHYFDGMLVNKNGGHLGCFYGCVNVADALNAVSLPRCLVVVCYLRIWESTCAS
jgi:hypothetical protein